MEVRFEIESNVEASQVPTFNCVSIARGQRQHYLYDFTSLKFVPVSCIYCRQDQRHLQAGDR